MLARLFDSLSSLYHDWRQRWTGIRVARLTVLKAGQAGAKRLAEITAHLDILNDDELDLHLHQYQRAT